MMSKVRFTQGSSRENSLRSRACRSRFSRNRQALSRMQGMRLIRCCGANPGLNRLRRLLHCSPCSGG